MSYASRLAGGATLPSLASARAECVAIKEARRLRDPRLTRAVTAVVLSQTETRLRIPTIYSLKSEGAETE
jgi:hypothetical protein